MIKFSVKNCPYLYKYTRIHIYVHMFILMFIIMLTYSNLYTVFKLK